MKCFGLLFVLKCLKIWKEIDKGGNVRVLFEVFENGKWWLMDDGVKSVGVIFSFFFSVFKCESDMKMLVWMK